MTITSPDTNDWETFCAWAAAENWKLSFQEQHLFLNQWRPYFYVMWKDGLRCGFVSAVRYKTSGWIGNLLVDPQQRHRGHGRTLFRFALDKLQGQPGVRRIWLTASSQGAPLYRQYGFAVIDTVHRWSASGCGDRRPVKHSALKELIDIDTHSWGESRASLINPLAIDSYSLFTADNAALLQTGVHFWQLGPWSTRGNSVQADPTILRQSLAATPKGKPLLMDILASAQLSLSLQHNGCSYQGSNALMCLSAAPPSMRGVIALASLGSIG
ncbi:MAG: GNAT family N-acetyltransferase [Desulfuromonadales bacterium]|nr:GNAT family N-acetyltransferase [Desulfuromonadales bacterium]MBN2792433.1 GNAT family N-acetyltransferase [Desulfuromonadales bacterium]